ncbi:MAG: 2-oxoacid:acceptor oxidoreductase subunit alpha [Candidatus Thorarchaeota archaeon]|nr:MAG: 2-oxoacid:acceptor oxidoreductase subunit alpha [Candidatus Thorarchaeota archaeon]
MDISFNVGGAAGQGIDTIGDLLTQVFVRAGFYTFTIKDYESRIRGGYNFTQIRVSDTPVFAPVSEIDVVVALSSDAITQPRDRLVDGGVIIYDDSVEFEEREACHFAAPLQSKAKEVGGDKRMTNAAALGVVLAVLQFPFELAEEALSSIFKKKGDRVIKPNVAVAKTLYDLTTESWTGDCRHNLSSLKTGPSEDRLLLNGNRALALGAMAANLKWISAYPMSPSTTVFQDIVSVARELKIGSLQTEDEISAMCMAIGASYAGSRAMVTTSGGGFSLKVEALGLAAMVETPVVIFNAQRPGPSTGLPTRTEQSDLLFMAHASQGEFPRIMLAPKDPVEGFDIATRAFNLADQFQVPVMILGDQHFSDSVMNVPRINATGVKIDRGKMAPSGPVQEGPYKRYLLTEDGISPRAFPGDEGKMVCSAGNVHTEEGHVSENPELRNAMVHKFLAKMPAILEALNPPIIEGPREAETTLLTWGSTWGAAFEAVNRMAADGVSVNQLHFSDIYPLRTETLNAVFERAKKVIAVEQNVTSQFARLVRMETGLAVNHHINKYDGRPMTANWIMSKLEEVGLK